MQEATSLQRIQQLSAVTAKQVSKARVHQNSKVSAVGIRHKLHGPASLLAQVHGTEE
jgi:hypothetical protein